MNPFLFFLVVLGIASPALGLTLPLHTSSRWILDANNERIKFRCINWAGHMETHLPEGLHKQSIDYLADWIRNQGFNCVRLTYSIDHALNPMLKVSDAFSQAASQAGVPVESMQSLYNSAVAKNPFLSTATTQDVYAAVVEKLWTRGVMTILDNHVSKATWCCNLTDGNGWWDSAFGYNDLNSRYFKTDQWLSGLQAMATWAQGRPGVVGMSLRNEIRQSFLQDLNGPHNDWFTYVSQAAKLVHSVNPDLLVVIGGISSATDLSFIRTRNLDTSGWSGKHVWEMHAYSFTVTFTDVFQSCDAVQAAYGLFDGFLLEQGKAYTGPLLLSEFGVGMTGGPSQGLSDADRRYLQCLVEYATGNDMDWALWALQGSYYARNQQTGYEEAWGALDKDWMGWRNAAFPGMLGEMWNATQGP
ncbi:putative cellulase family protein [Phaeoacremonium minimum UCRPA7]|uniref:Putative cellulase family protein n=1 Tax=Phaeoacremonium minimum (strain UCR-PA7) TaxID=1286976 RepID=R8BYG9_PHAM7|nr:putative cellulase family protein [Phaeoacremonium minimum UCRPA7]EOO04403.1 putative cellulase family protein [Phaeoacremonium minimum UCRPA7]